MNQSTYLRPSQLISVRFISATSSHLLFDLPRGCCTEESSAKMLYIFVFSPIIATRPDHRKLLDFLTNLDEVCYYAVFHIVYLFLASYIQIRDFISLGTLCQAFVI